MDAGSCVRSVVTYSRKKSGDLPGKGRVDGTFRKIKLKGSQASAGYVTKYWIWPRRHLEHCRPPPPVDVFARPFACGRASL